MFEGIFEDVLFDILLIIVEVGTGGGETLGRLMFCDWFINVPPPLVKPLPGPDDCDILVGLFGLGLILLLIGVVVSLDWNKRDLQQYFDNNILVNPTAYQYNSPPVLNFVPSTPAGGGARAEVLVYGGPVIDNFTNIH